MALALKILAVWLLLNVAFVVALHLATRDRKARRQAVFDAFDRKAVR